MTITKAPSHVTTVDQHRGDHKTGMRMMQLTEVTTRFSDYSQESWESLSDEQREWWTETLADMHAAEVELAELDSDHRNAAKEYIADRIGSGDLEDHAAIIRRAIEETATGA